MTRTVKFQIGDRVQSGEGDEHDVGVVMAATGSDAKILHADDAVFVSWQSGVQTWTPTEMLRRASLFGSWHERRSTKRIGVKPYGK